MTKDLLGADYYSVESARAFWSISQYKRFRECEARALAELRGEWEDKRDDTALLVGNFVHSYFESEEAHEKFKAKHGSAMISSRGASKGQLKKEFQIAERMIERLERDVDFMKYYVGEKEVAVTGEIGGVLFKGKIDCLNVEQGYFVDIKTTKGSIDDEVWVKDRDTGQNRKVRWFEAYGYILQMAAYKKMLEATYGREFMPIIYAVTKEDECDSRAIVFKNDVILNAALAELEHVIQRLDKVKCGELPATPCQRCDFCRHEGLTQRVEII